MSEAWVWGRPQQLYPPNKDDSKSVSAPTQSTGQREGKGSQSWGWWRWWWRYHHSVPMSVEKLTTSFMKKLNFSITFPMRKHKTRFVKQEVMLCNVGAKRNYRNYEAELNVIDEETESLKRKVLAAGSFWQRQNQSLSSSVILLPPTDQWGPSTDPRTWAHQPISYSKTGGGLLTWKAEVACPQPFLANEACDEAGSCVSENCHHMSTSVSLNTSQLLGQGPNVCAC